MRDIEWLKEQIKAKIKFDAINDKEIGFKIAMDEVLSLIDQLDTREVLSNEWIENHTACADNISHYSEEPVAVILVDDLKGLLLDPNPSNSMGLKEVNIKQVKEVTE